MNTLRIYPKKIRLGYIRNVKDSGIKLSAERYHRIALNLSFLTSAFSTIAFFYFGINVLFTLPIFLFMMIFFYFNASLKASARIRKMEQLFPDVISLMASNLRAGMTIDRAFLLSSRKEFDPLDQFILEAGREITTGEEVVKALNDMAKRINSQKISKTLNVIVSGLRAGGNISNILEQSSKNLKEREFIEKKVISNVLMYVIFIVFAVGVGAPILFSLSSVLVEVVISISSQVPEVDTTGLTVPITFSAVSISPDFVLYFSIFFLIVTNLISSLVIGLVSNGEEKTGLKYFIPLVVASLFLFFILRLVLGGFFEGIFVQ